MESAGVVIVAAGQGSRLGLGPKALVELEGEPLVSLLARRALEAGFRRVVAVLPPGVPCPVPDLAFTTNDLPETGPLGSVIRGLESLEARAPIRGLAVWPVDHPWVGSDQLEALARFAETASEDSSRIVPAWSGRRGHPIWVCAAGLAAIRAVREPASTTLREVLAGAGATLEVGALSAAVLQNLNRPEDLP